MKNFIEELTILRNEIIHQVGHQNIIEDTSSNIILKQQHYPNSFGISFVFNKTKHINNDLQISLCYRKYKHISKKKILENKIAILVNEYKVEIIWDH